MNIQVTADQKKPLFKRREITARLGYADKTPSRLEIRKELAKKLNVKEELVVVTRINPAYGAPAAKLDVIVYDDEKALKAIEAEYMVNRHLPKEEKEKKSEEKKAEKPEKAPKPDVIESGKKKEEPADVKKEEAPKEESKKEEKKEEKN